MGFSLKMALARKWIRKCISLLAKQQYYFFIVTNSSRTVLLTGITPSLSSQLEQWQKIRDKTGDLPGSSEICYHILYWERFTNLEKALIRKKEVASWPQQKINALAESEKKPAVRIKKIKTTTYFNKIGPIQKILEYFAGRCYP